MIAIGLGKQLGASACHAAASHLGHEAVIRAVAKAALSTARILCAVAVVEDQNHQTAEIMIPLPIDPLKSAKRVPCKNPKKETRDNAV